MKIGQGKENSIKNLYCANGCDAAIAVRLIQLRISSQQCFKTRLFEMLIVRQRNYPTAPSRSVFVKNLALCQTFTLLSLRLVEICLRDAFTVRCAITNSATLPRGEGETGTAAEENAVAFRDSAGDRLFSTRSAEARLRDRLTSALLFIFPWLDSAHGRSGTGSN